MIKEPTFKEELNQLLIDIQEWMMDNDYECGEQGSELYHRITQKVKEIKNEQN